MKRRSNYCFRRYSAAAKTRLRANALDRSIDPQRIQAVWGEWHGREHEFYLACARLVDALTWADVLRVCGPSLRIQAKLLTQTYHALINKQPPLKLKLNDLKIVKLAGASMQLSTYSTLDPKRRSVLKVTINDALETDRVMNDLMGKDPSARYRFIMERARDAKEIDV